MPSRLIPTSSGVLGSVLIVAGLGYAGIGASWIVTPSQQRLSGAQWLGIADSVTIVGIIWIIVGLLTASCGVLSSCRAVETAGTLVSIAWPTLLGLYFLSAWILGHLAGGWGVAIAYFTFAAIIWAVAAQPRPPVKGRGDLEAGSNGWD